jgi:hypothetical protein
MNFLDADEDEEETFTIFKKLHNYETRLCKNDNLHDEGCVIAQLICCVIPPKIDKIRAHLSDSAKNELFFFPTVAFKSCLLKLSDAQKYE